jgi:ribonuclease P protein component
MEKLRRREEFEAVLAARSPALVSPCFVVRALVRQSGPARLGIIVSRKALARAVERNRVKRLVRETFRACGHELPPTDVVVLVRSACRRTSAASARASLATLLGQLARSLQQ